MHPLSPVIRILLEEPPMRLLLALDSGSDRLAGARPSLGADAGPNCRARRVHGAGARAARRKLEESSAIHPRRAGAGRVSRTRRNSAVGRETRIHLVSARRVLRAEPGAVQRRRHQRERAREVRAELSADGRRTATSARKQQGRETEGTADAARPTSRASSSKRASRSSSRQPIC